MIVVLLFIIVSTLTISEIDISRLKPILSNGATLVLRGALSSFSFPFGEVVVFTMIFSNISKVKNYNKIFMVGLSLGGLIVFLATLRNLLVIGSETASMVYFPSILTISLVHLGPIFQRLEISIVLLFLVGAFVKTIICLFAVCNGISKIFGFKDYRFIATPVTFLMINFSLFIYLY